MKKNNKKNIRKVNNKENGLKQKILEINLSKATIITSIIVILSIALITAGIIKTINESNKEKVEVEEEEEYSPVNWIESTEIGEDGNYKKVPVPKGYVASQIEGETTVNGGFVIYEDNYNGKSINWDEIIIKDDSVSTENSSDASVVNEDGGEKDNRTNSEMPETPETPPSEDESVDDATTIPTDVPEEEQTEQEEFTGNDENIENGENPVIDEEGTKPEESVVLEEPVQNESGVSPQTDESTGNEGDTTDPTELETPTAEQQTKKNIFDLQKSVNQYVWVPVPDINRICGADANGKMWGKLYSFNSSGANSPFASGSSNYSWTEDEGKIVTPPSGKTKTGEWYREPDIVLYSEADSSTYYNDRDSRLKRFMYGETRQEMLLEEMEQEFYETMKSIEKYGGYYIGRYETGDLKSSGVSAVVRKMNTSIASVIWYQMYKGCKGLAGDNENVKTSMIWGNYIDATFKYIPAEADEPEETAEKAYDTKTKIPTGSAEYTKVNNIYDMAGNVWDWTLEARSTSYRAYRGGAFDFRGDYNPASNRYGNYPGVSNNGYVVGCRAALIISDIS